MTFEEVKKAFFRYDGSLFAMAREEKEAYESYIFQRKWQKHGNKNCFFPCGSN